MIDGLYIVTTRWFTAAFVVEGEQVVMCAPVCDGGLSSGRRWR